MFNKKNALITGASRGLGREVAINLASMGCNLHILGRDEEKLNETKSILTKESTVYVKTSVVDFCDEYQLNEFLKKDITVDILINCAGLFPIKNICESTIKDYNDCFNVNVKAPFALSKKFAEGMKKNKWGRIVNIASSSAYNGSGETGLYCSSKHALLGLSRSLYQELKPHNIRVYNVAPGSIQTDMGATDTRQKFSTFLNAKEVAEYITYIMKFDNEMIPEEIKLSRMVIE
jgi:3-oxoacyl-[acyl-carrier protein] reductase